MQKNSLEEWNYFFKLLKKKYIEDGYVHAEAYTGLARYINRLKKENRDGLLSEEKTEQLNSINFPWTPKAQKKLKKMFRKN